MTKESDSFPGEKPIEIFISYSHRDENLKDDLIAHLMPMLYEGLIEIWQDRDIDLAKEWGKEIDIHVNTAEIILLLISPRFIASQYCYGIEMKRAMERHETGEARVIPVILSHCDFGNLPFAKLNAAPKDAIPILDKRWGSTDEALCDVAVKIRRLVNKMRSEKQ
ncbi:MAG TPA: toll/interleukin-1 receptor domain-containing protein [Pyrinomonadaceae bacterium]|jgi:hypothetical protein